MPAALAENSQVICEVWANNLEEEMRKIREIVLSYSYIAMVNTYFSSELKIALQINECFCFKFIILLSEKKSWNVLTIVLSVAF